MKRSPFRQFRQFFQNLQIRKKLIICFSLLIVLPVTLMTLFYLNSSRYILEKQSSEYTSDILTALQKNIEYTAVELDTIFIQITNDSETQAKAMPNAQWTASVGTNRLNLTNGTGQKLYYSSNTFLVSENASTGTNITFNSGRISSNSRYFSSISGGVGQTSWNPSNALTFSLSKQTVSTTTVPVEAGTIAYRITNTPAEEAELISLAVRKDWVPGNMGSGFCCAIK